MLCVLARASSPSPKVKTPHGAEISRCADASSHTSEPLLQEEPGRQRGAAGAHGGLFIILSKSHVGPANTCRSYHPFLFEHYSRDGSLSPPFICNSILKVFKGSLMTQRAREWHFCRAHFKLAVNNNDRRGIHLLSCHTDNNKYSEYVRYAFESS